MRTLLKWKLDTVIRGEPKQTHSVPENHLSLDRSYEQTSSEFPSLYLRRSSGSVDFVFSSCIILWSPPSSRRGGLLVKGD